MVIHIDNGLATTTTDILVNTEGLIIAYRTKNKDGRKTFKIIETHLTALCAEKLVDFLMWEEV